MPECLSFVIRMQKHLYCIKRKKRFFTIVTISEKVLIPEVVILKPGTLYDHYRQSTRSCKIRNFSIYKQNMISMALYEKMLICCPYCSQWIYSLRASSPVWAGETGLAKTRERAAKLREAEERRACNDPLQIFICTSPRRREIPFAEK